MRILLLLASFLIALLAEFDFGSVCQKKKKKKRTRKKEGCFEMEKSPALSSMLDNCSKFEIGQPLLLPALFKFNCIVLNKRTELTLCVCAFEKDEMVTRSASLLQFAASKN